MIFASDIMKVIASEIINKEETNFIIEIKKNSDTSIGVTFETYTHRKITSPGFDLALKRLFPNNILV